MTLLALALLLQTGPTADSARTQQAVSQAQAEFERGRIWMIASTPPGAAGSCDVKIGRYCYWYNENEPPPPPDTQGLLLARGTLLDQLNKALTRYPGDFWLTGQIVRYLIEDRRADSALAIVDSCKTTPWWCSALKGMVYHISGYTQTAERAFEDAIRQMSEERRCAWNNLRPLITGYYDGAYKDLTCAQRDSANAHLLWLGRPQFSALGNPLRTEIYARRTWLATFENAITQDGSPMGDDLVELVFRYGWSTAWSQNSPPPGVQGAGYSIVGHEPKPAYSFMPDHEDEAGFPEWKWKDPKASSRFHPIWATGIVWIDEVQWTRFLRGDKAMTVASFRAPWAHKTAQFTDVTLALSAGPEEGDPIPGFGTSHGPRGVARALGTWGRRLLASLEVIDPGSGMAAIGRTVLEPLSEGQETGPMVSDILLFEPGEDLPEGLDAAMKLARSGTTVPVGSAVGLYWETYRAGAGEAFEVSLAVEQARAGLLKRVGRTFGLGGKARPIKLSWNGAGGEGVVAQSIEVDLADLPKGRYSIILTLKRGTEPELQTVREIEIVAR
jgi:hypothetical protein